MENKEKEKKHHPKTEGHEEKHKYPRCQVCGHPLRMRSGSCHICSNCGSSSGCS